MKKITFVIILGCIYVSLNAQYIAKDSYWFYFTDKDETSFTVDEPSQFLSKRAIERRAWQNLPIDESDLPICQNYVDSLKSMNLNIKYSSKWLNGVLIQSENQSLIDTLCRLTFIDTLAWVKDPSVVYFPIKTSESRFDAPKENIEFQYGFALDQISQLRLDELHYCGYTGAGVIVAVLDAGFMNMPYLPSFQRHYQEELILPSRNFVHPDKDVYDFHTHGTNVSSIIVANWNDTLIGTAPDAKLILGMTENPASETKIEELAWVAGIEWADSLGADIVNTSLGYTLFDDTTTNYTYKSLDGRTSLASRANSMAAQKGIISVTSAGNEGNDPWYYIGTPADATDILAVGAVYSDGMLTAFSSHGPSYDNRIKPEIVAMGGLTAVQGTDGSLRLGSGTSFSSPVIAGATACLWQAYPYLSAKELMRMIINAGDQRWTANVNYGYGIPDYMAAFHHIAEISEAEASSTLSIFPNPFDSQFYLQIPEIEQSEFMMSIIDLSGRIIFNSGIAGSQYVSVPSIPSGVYILQLDNGIKKYRSSIIKK